MTEEKVVKEELAEKKIEEKPEKLAVIRIRGQHDLPQTKLSAMKMLNLLKKNTCVVIDAHLTNIGMIKKAKDYITWGEIDSETFKLLVEKRGEEFKGRTQDSKGKIKYTSKFIEIDGKKIKPFFRLHPPRGGFERKGIKIPFKVGGALGNRDKKINDLIKRML